MVNKVEELDTIVAEKRMFEFRMEIVECGPFSTVTLLVWIAVDGTVFVCCVVSLKDQTA